MKIVRNIILRTMIILTVLSLLSLPGASQQVVARTQPQLIELAAQNPAQMIRVIVQKLGPAQNVDTLVAQLGGKVTTDLSMINAFAAELSAAAALQLSRSSDVHWVSLDAPVEHSGKPQPTSTASTSTATTSASNTYLDTLGVRQLWNMGLNGKGIGVAVVDSGIATDADFTTNPKSVSFATNSSTPTDIYGHGTHVAGIVAGNGKGSNGNIAGIAPGATLYNLKIADGTGMAYESDVVAALQWVYDNKALYNIRVVNLSLNSTVEQPYNISPMDAAVEILWFNGVVVVVSVGNVDPANPIRLYNAAPSNDPFVISVGATDEKGTASFTDDIATSYTSSGISMDGELKPNIYAPGSNIYSVLSKNSSWATQYPDRVTPDGEYIRLSGTSMSAPMVTGAVVLLLQDEPTLTPDQVKYRLMNSTARSFSITISGTVYTVPYLDIYAAVTGTSTSSANTGRLPSMLLMTGSEPALWSSVGWNSVGWNSVGWNSVGWNSVGWNSVGWNSTFWGK